MGDLDSPPLKTLNQTDLHAFTLEWQRLRNLLIEKVDSPP
jgi:hypothetical protein